MEPTFATRWFYQHIAQATVAPGRYTCAVCGLPAADATPLAKTLRPTFTDYAALRAPQSVHICPACAWYMSRQDLRRESWWLTHAAARQLSKHEVGPLLAAHLAQPPAENGYYLVTVMRRKHLALYAPLNLAHNPVRRVRFEVVTLDLETDAWPALVAAAHALRGQHTWEEVLTGRYNAHNLARWPTPADFARAEATVQPWRGTPYLDLARFVYVPPAGQPEADAEPEQPALLDD